MSENKPPPGVVRRRLPFNDPKATTIGAGVGLGSIALAILTLILVGLCLYMALVVRHPLTSSYVLAPAVGAVWFGLRLFMTLGGRG